MSIFQFFVQYFFVIICSVGLIIILEFNRGAGSSRMRKTMVGNALFTILFAVVDYTQRFSETLPDLITLQISMRILGYLLRVLPLFSLILVIRRRSGHEIGLALPMILDVLLVSTTWLTGLVFWYDSDGDFQRGPLGFYPHLVGAFYLLLLLYHTMRLFYNRYIKEALIMLYIVLIAILSLGLEMYVDRHDLVTTAYAACNLMYYMFIHTQVSSRDALTRLLTRASCYEDCKRYEGDIAGFISIDMNELKWINDSLGHEVGDRAIQTVSDCITGNLGPQFPSYRLGGDEFCAIIWKKHVKSVDTAVKKFRDSLARTEYSCAVGVSYNEPDAADPKSLHDLFHEADQRMYQDKEELKAKAKAEGKVLHPRK